jgi:predicted ester cyclase
MNFAAFPDSQFTIEDAIAEGDKVATRYINRGTHQGEMMGIPPTGKQVTLSGIVITRFADGKAVEVWNNADDLGTLQPHFINTAFEESVIVARYRRCAHPPTRC